MSKKVALAFDPKGIMVPVGAILPLKQLGLPMKSSQKYQQILASVREIGLIEPLTLFFHKMKKSDYIFVIGRARPTRVS